MAQIPRSAFEQAAQLFSESISRSPDLDSESAATPDQERDVSYAEFERLFDLAETTDAVILASSSVPSTGRLVRLADERQRAAYARLLRSQLSLHERMASTEELVLPRPQFAGSVESFFGPTDLPRLDDD